MSFIPELFGHPLLPEDAKNDAFNRCISDPGLPLEATPVAPVTRPFWLETPHPLFSDPPTVPLPQEVDILVIGSGITGTSVARHLLRSSSAAGLDVPKVLMVEARAICSGATGRNGGHINEVGYSDYMHLAELYGREAAAKITKFRIGHLDELLKIAEEEGLVKESQIRLVQGVGAFYDGTALDVATRGLMGMKSDLGDVVKEWGSVEKDTAVGLDELKRMGLANSEGAIRGRAGAVWPYKLVTGILFNLLRDYPDSFQVFGHTPATGIYRTSDGLFVVETPRGYVQAKHVVHATNGYVGHLLQGLRGAIFPLRGQMSAQKAPAWFPYQAEERSWSFEYEVGFDYLTQIPYNKSLKSQSSGSEEETREERKEDEGGDLMFGGGFAQTQNCGLGELGVTDDSILNPEAEAHLNTALSKAFNPPTNTEKIGDFQVKSMWTGIMGFSTDSLPWVGKLSPSITKRTLYQDTQRTQQVEISIVSKHIKVKTNGHQEIKGAEWVSAAYNGEGMVNAWGCGKACASMLLDREAEDGLQEWFPDEMRFTEDRLSKERLEKIVKKGREAVAEDELGSVLDRCASELTAKCHFS